MRKKTDNIKIVGNVEEGREKVLKKDGDRVKQLIAFLLFCLLLAPSTAYCEIYIVKSAFGGPTIAVPIYHNEYMNVYATNDTLKDAVCTSNYAQDGKFFMRMYYECNNQNCVNELAESYREGLADKTLTVWSAVDPGKVYLWSADTIFDLHGGKAITGMEIMYDKWGYVMASRKFTPGAEEELNPKYPFSFEIANRLNNILAKQLQEARENPHSCLNNGSQRRIINQQRLPGY